MKTLSPSTKPTGATAPRTAIAAQAGLWLWRHGAWLPVVLVLLLAAGALLVQAATLRERAQAVAVVQAAAPASAPLPARASSDAANAAALRRLLPPAAEATAQVRKLVELTRPQLAWQRAEFQQNDDGGLLRVQITVPVAGEYAAMRDALDRALAELPHLSLDQVQLRRLQPDATRLEARLRFSLWLSSAPATEPTR